MKTLYKRKDKLLNIIHTIPNLSARFIFFAFRKKENTDINKKLLCVSYCIVMKYNWSLLSSNQSTKKEGMEKEHTSTSAEPAEPAEPALVKAPNLSFLFFSFSSSSIWKKQNALLQNEDSQRAGIV